jgi:hypothetical protein
LSSFYSDLDEKFIKDIEGIVLDSVQEIPENQLPSPQQTQEIQESELPTPQQTQEIQVNDQGSHAQKYEFPEVTKKGSSLELECDMSSSSINSLEFGETQSTSFDKVVPASLLETSLVFEDPSVINQTTLEDSMHCLSSQDHMPPDALLDQSSHLSPDQAYSAKVQTFLRARNLNGEFSRMEKTSSRGRPQSSGRLYEKTRSFEVKCELRKAKEEMIQHFQHKRSQSVGVRTRPTTPQSPRFHTSSRSSRETEATKLTSEELTYRAVQEQKRIQEKIMKKHQHMFQNLKNKRNSTAPVTARSTKELTIPTTPYSHVDHRLGKREVVLLPEEKKEIKSKKLGPTHVQPFQFSTDLRASLRGDESLPASESFTAGEILAKFHRDPRSHDVPPAHSSVTRPLSPKLRTSSRSDAVYGRPKPPSRVEQEEAEFQAAQSHTFKAKPVNKRILQSTGDLGVPKVQPKETTQPQEFHLASSQRAAYRASMSHSDQDQDTKATFKARPMPSFEEDPRKVVRRCESKLTEAHSPKLHGPMRASSAPARRQRMSHQDVEKKKKEAALKAQAESKQRLKLTEPEEFELQTSRRGLAARAALEARIRREQEEEKAKSELHARPFPEKVFKEMFIPAPSSKPLTEIEEFHLATDDRYLKSLTSSSHHHPQENDAENHGLSVFHARPVPKSTYQPSFSVEPSPREPLIPKDINLSTSLRAIQRKSFDETVSQHQENVMKQKELSDKQQELELQKEIKRLRSQSIEEGGYAFKATPILHEDPFPTKYVEPHKLTEPISPKLQTSLRVRSKNNDIRIQM